MLHTGRYSAGMEEQLRRALQDAIAEILRHNGDYHHTTPAHKVKAWEELVSNAPARCPACQLVGQHSLRCEVEFGGAG